LGASLLTWHLAVQRATTLVTVLYLEENETHFKPFFDISQIFTNENNQA
jgi:hypothetical protein